jgi:hypothetical protein
VTQRASLETVERAEAGCAIGVLQLPEVRPTLVVLEYSRQVARVRENRPEITH